MRSIAVLFILPAMLSAQTNSCALSGTVQDAGGAVIAGITVRLTGEGNGFVRTATTTGEGFFSFPDLTAATFTLEIESPGFKTYRQTGIAMTSGEQRSLGQIHLDVGAVTEQVTVTAGAVAVNLVSGEKSGILTNDELDHLALRGRDIFDAGWPQPDEAALKQAEMELVLQVNGKMRGSIRVPSEASRAQIEKLTLSSAIVQKYIAGQGVKKVVVVPGRLVNVVV